MQSTKPDNWQNLGSLEQLEAEGRALTKVAGKQIALFETEAGLFAINNRCPHEGYPLLEGSLQDDCTLACNWHGWTFDLKSGETIQGRDPVKKYPVERRNGEIWIDLTPEDSTALREKALAEFQEARAEHDYDRMARALCRLELAEGSYEDAVVDTLLWSADAFERGFGHAHAGLADWIAMAGDDADLRLIGFLEGLGHFSWDGLFSPAAKMTDRVLPWSENALLEAIEAMDGEAAVAYVNGAFEAGLGFAELKAIFVRFVFAHYAGFGHPAIYIVKAEELIARLGNRVEKSLCAQLARYFCVAAREDKIPEFKLFGDILSAPCEANRDLGKAELLSGMPLRQILPLVGNASGSPETVWEKLLCAAALDMLRFDDPLQHGIAQPVAQNVGWLDFTHTVTFSEALYQLARNQPDIWRSGHLQQACFIGRNSKFLGANQLNQWLVPDRRVFLARQKAALFDMDVGEYIYAVHRLKLIVAVEKLLDIVRPATANLLLAALNRFLNSQVRQRHPARSAYQARVTVERE